jgi:hypothetical protein
LLQTMFGRQLIKRVCRFLMGIALAFTI